MIRASRLSPARTRSIPRFSLTLSLAVAFAVPASVAQEAPETIFVHKEDSTWGLTLGEDLMSATPDTLRKAKEPIDTATELQRAKASKRMTDEMQELQAAAALTPPQRKELEEAAGQAVSQCVAAWSARVGPFLARVHERVSGLPTASLRELLQTTALTRPKPGESPCEHQVWTSALQRVLSPEQQIAWKRADTERRPRWATETIARVQPMIQIRREALKTSIAEEIAILRRDLAWPLDRAAELERKAVELETRQIASWEDRIKATVSAAPAPDLDQTAVIAMLQRAAVKPPPSDEELWADALQKLVAPPEQKQYEQLRAARVDRRKDAVARFILSDFDEYVALTAGQREALLPIIARLMPRLSEYRNGSMGDSIPPLRSLAKVPAAELKSVLDDQQWARWQSACQEATESAPVSSSASSVVDEESDERVIAEFFAQKAEQEKQTQLQKMLVTAEDATRVIPLVPLRSRSLELAARGAVEAVHGQYRTALEQNTRSQLRGYEGQSANSRRSEFAQMGTFSLSGPEYSPERTPIWTNALRTLEAVEQDKWRGEVAQRAAFRQEAAAKAALAELDRSVVMSAAQWKRLQSPLLQFMHDYLPDLEANSMGSGRADWLRDYYSRYVPAVAIEVEAKAALEAEQWNRLTQGGWFEQGRFYWDRIKSQHDRRLKVSTKE